MMDYNLSNDITKFIQDIIKIRSEYEKNKILDEKMILLCKCIDYFNEHNTNIEKNQSNNNQYIQHLEPNYFGDGYFNTEMNLCADTNSCADMDPHINGYTSEESAYTSSSSVTTIASVESIEDDEKSNFSLSDSDDDKDIDDNDIEKVTKMVAISKVHLNKAIKSKMLIIQEKDEESD